VGGYDKIGRPHDREVETEKFHSSDQEESPTTQKGGGGQSTKLGGLGLSY